MHMLQSLFYLIIALHVSGIIITHLQEHKTTVTTASGNRYTVTDRVKFTDKEYYMYLYLYTCSHYPKDGHLSGRNMLVIIM